MPRGRDAVCRGCWELHSACGRCQKCLETATHVCPVCGRLGGEGSWLSHPTHGYRYCPECREGGWVIPCENPDYKGVRPYA
jgi:hypothetical protein